MDDLALVQDINALMEYAEDEDLLDYDLIIDVTYSSGGSGGAFAIQRLVDRLSAPRSVMSGSATLDRNELTGIATEPPMAALLTYSV